MFRETLTRDQVPRKVLDPLGEGQVQQQLEERYSDMRNIDKHDEPSINPCRVWHNIDQSNSFASKNIMFSNLYAYRLCAHSDGFSHPIVGVDRLTPQRWDETTCRSGQAAVMARIFSVYSWATLATFVSAQPIVVSLRGIRTRQFLKMVGIC